MYVRADEDLDGCLESRDQRNQFREWGPIHPVSHIATPWPAVLIHEPLVSGRVHRRGPRGTGGVGRTGDFVDLVSQPASPRAFIAITDKA